MSARRSRRPRVRVQESRFGRELIVDETFASFQRSDGTATQCVWDAIAAPALALDPARAPRVLVLGLGGGSAARIVRALHPRAEIVGVEIDADVIAAAREHFDLASLRIEVHAADALAYLREERRRFDLVLEDVFVGHGDGVHKPDWIPHPLHDLARRRLRPRGILVTNTIDEWSRVQGALCAAFENVLRIEVEDYDNRIFAASNVPLAARGLRGRLAGSDVLRDSLPLLTLRTVRLGRPAIASEPAQRASSRN